MPIYEYECKKHGRTERLFNASGSIPDWVKCPDCGKRAEFVYSRVTVRPDTYWHGVKTQYGYFTSAKGLKAEMKRRNHVTVGDRTDREGMDKIAEKGAVEREEKTKKRIRGVMERAFGPSGLGLGGADGEKMLKETK